MRPIRFAVIAAVALLASQAFAAPLCTLANAEPPWITADTLKPAGAADTGAIRVATKGKVLFDGTGAAGANASGVLDVTGLTQIYVVVTNGDAATRNITLDTYLDDGATNVDAGLVLFAATASNKSRGVIGASPGALGTPALNFAFPIGLPTKLQITVAAGTTSSRLTIYGR